MCDLFGSEGSVCGLCFDSQKKLAARATRARGVSSGAPRPLRCCAIVNQRLNCTRHRGLSGVAGPPGPGRIGSCECRARLLVQCAG
eukprot:6204312-Pyramimonas_sp.AAC.1